MPITNLYSLGSNREELKVKKMFVSVDENNFFFEKTGRSVKRGLFKQQ